MFKSWTKKTNNFQRYRNPSSAYADSVHGFVSSNHYSSNNNNNSSSSYNHHAKSNGISSISSNTSNFYNNNSHNHNHNNGNHHNHSTRTSILSTSNMGQEFYFTSPNRLRNRRLHQQIRNLIYVALFGLFYHTVFLSKKQYPLSYGTFPSNFKWGVATSSYQIEGAWNEDGKTASIWDDWTHQVNNSSNIIDHSNADVTCDSYHRIHEDIQMLRKLNVNFYRFSISWPRLIPDIDSPENVNLKGVKYYSTLIDMLEHHNIEPFVTLYHWDLPSKLQQKYGGWQNISTADRFEEYAQTAFRFFGDKVKKWVTFNEPRETALGGYEHGYMAPGLRLDGYGTYNTSYTILMAHAKAYRLYENKFKSTQNGKIGITLNCDWGEIKKPMDLEYQEAQNRYLQWYMGIWAHPIFKGDYPEVIRSNVLRKSNLLNLDHSRLPKFSKEEIIFIKGTADFLGLNHYTSRIVEPARSFEDLEDEIEENYNPGFSDSFEMNEINNQYDENQDALVSREKRMSKRHPFGTYNDDSDVHTLSDPAWEKTGSEWLQIVPWGLKKLLIWISREYPEIDAIWITENGVSEKMPENYDYRKMANLCDKQRVFYFKAYINELMQAVVSHKIPVLGYTAWSLMDNFEWSRGYTERFGLHWVNFDSPTKERIIKASGYFYNQIIRHNGFPSKSEVDVWEDQALDQCTTFSAMAQASGGFVSVVNLVLTMCLQMIIYCAVF